jgi:isopentenyl-diphosphate delta-isomerase
VADLVTLIDEQGRSVGAMEKLEAHRIGALHRAVSVIIRNSAGDWLLQRRSASKYHSASLWSNTCCGHPRPNEGSEEAAHRRLLEEMGIKSDLALAFEFRYKAAVSADLVENELVSVFSGHWEGSPRPNPDEADGWAWIDLDTLYEAVAATPERYTVWFCMYVERDAKQSLSKGSAP